MKIRATLLPTVLAVLGLSCAAHAKNEKLTQALITKIVKDVKTVEPKKGSRPAVLKEIVQGDESVRTGLESRAELYFNDKTITRLGANTHFSFEEGTRNMSLQSGVILLQVPKNIGGAKIETAAVTAAVTGTTILIEAGKDFTKLIVLEGECCLTTRNGRQGNALVLFKKKVCATAGQEIIVRNGAKKIPGPVFVNLKLIERTSLLLRGRWGAPLNIGIITDAADGQKTPERIITDPANAGAGTDTTITRGKIPNNPPPPPPRIIPPAPPTRPQ